MPFQGRNFIPQGRNGHTSFEADRQAGGRPEPSLFDGFMRDIAEGLASVLRLDGSVAMRAPFNGGGFRFTNAADATDEADLVTRRQLTEAGRVLPLTPAQVAQNGAAISLSPPIAWTSYAAGQQAEFFVEENVEATNVTIQVSGLGRVGLLQRRHPDPRGQHDRRAVRSHRHGWRPLPPRRVQHQCAPQGHQ